ncbi:hypothetical protein ACFXP3_16460 [Streptomyces sp. NPDC059096]|uniref:Mu transposase domain-containing protein n=1 Tax=Streptomyces sp. NPDC059096 TaxID=3346727 RepID=UPI0036BDA797
MPQTPYVVAQRHLRYVGKDCLAAFEANPYSVPALRVRPRHLVEIRATKSQIMLHATAPDHRGETLLATHPRGVGRGARVVDETHWNGLPTGAGRRVTAGGDLPSTRRQPSAGAGSLTALLNRAAATQVEVGRRRISINGPSYRLKNRLAAIEPDRDDAAWSSFPASFHSSVQTCPSE